MTGTNCQSHWYTQNTQWFSCQRYTVIHAIRIRRSKSDSSFAVIIWLFLDHLVKLMKTSTSSKTKFHWIYFILYLCIQNTSLVRNQLWIQRFYSIYKLGILVQLNKLSISIEKYSFAALRYYDRIRCFCLMRLSNQHLRTMYGLWLVHSHS